MLCAFEVLATTLGAGQIVPADSLRSKPCGAIQNIAAAIGPIQNIAAAIGPPTVSHSRRHLAAQTRQLAAQKKKSQRSSSCGGSTLAAAPQ